MTVAFKYLNSVVEKEAKSEKPNKRKAKAAKKKITRKNVPSPHVSSYSYNVNEEPLVAEQADDGKFVPSGYVTMEKEDGQEHSPKDGEPVPLPNSNTNVLARSANFLEEKMPSANPAMFPKAGAASTQLYHPRGYSQIQPPLNPSLYCNNILYGPNQQLNCIMYNSQCLNKIATDPCTVTQFRRPPQEPQGSPFRRCSMHIAIAYHIQVTKKKVLRDLLFIGKRRLK